MARPTIVYILSESHSGSTLLDVLLSSHAEAVSVGELKQIVQREDPRCTCEAHRVRHCAFWGEVRSRLLQRTGLPLFEQDLYSEDPEAFRAANQAVYEEVAAVAGVSVIVDSSKDPLRLERLLADGSFDLRVIHLLRRANGVVFSHVRKGRNWLGATIRYGRGLDRARRALAGHPHRQLRYEDLASGPEETVRGLMEWIGVPFDPGQLDWSGRTRHNVGGNHMRFSKSSEIRLDESWRELPLGRRIVVFLVTLGARIRMWLLSTPVAR